MTSVLLPPPACRRQREAWNVPRVTPLVNKGWTQTQPGHSLTWGLRFDSRPLEAGPKLEGLGFDSGPPEAGPKSEVLHRESFTRCVEEVPMTDRFQTWLSQQALSSSFLPLSVALIMAPSPLFPVLISSLCFLCVSCW